MKENTRVVGFSGVDGAGKSSQVKELISYFEVKNISYRVLYARSENTKICKILSNLLEQNADSRVLKKIYIIVNYIIWIDYYCIKVRRKMKNDVLIMDRTIIDNAVDVSCKISQKVKIPDWLMKRYTYIYIYAENDILFERLIKRGESYNQDVFCMKKELYNCYFREVNID